MTQEITDQLANAIELLMSAPDLAPDIDAAHKSYAASNYHTQAGQKLIALMEQAQQANDPVEQLLTRAWSDGIGSASHQGLIKFNEKRLGSTVFADRWRGLAERGAGKDRSQYQSLAVLLAQTTRNTIFHTGARPEGDSRHIAEKLLKDIANGDLARGPGNTEYFTNFADGAALTFEMKAWQPCLRNDGRLPADMPDGVIFKTSISIPSGRLIVSDQIQFNATIDKLSDLRKRLGLSVNYAWHRITRTGYSASRLNIIDVATGSDGPGLVRAHEQGVIYGGQDSSDFPAIAKICHSYWGTTMIDRTILATMLVESEEAADLQDAEAQIDLIVQTDDNHTEIVVAPGEWYFYWDDDRSALDKALRLNSITAPNDTRFALTQDAFKFEGAIVFDHFGT